DQDPDRVPELAAAAKATISEAFLHVTREGIQFHGGVGVTDEYDIGLYLKRAHVVAATFGDASWQRDRWASLRGYSVFVHSLRVLQTPRVTCRGTLCFNPTRPSSPCAFARLRACKCKRFSNAMAW